MIVVLGGDLDISHQGRSPMRCNSFYRTFRTCAAQEFRLASKLTGKQPFNLYMCIVAREEPPVIVGLETAGEMNLVRLELCATVFQVDGNCSV